MSSEKYASDQPMVELETYIIAPFQLAQANPNDSLNAESFRAYLAEEQRCWARANNIHEPDRMSPRSLDIEERRIRYQAYNYFHPFVRSFWYDRNLVQRFRHQQLRSLKAGFKDREFEFDAVADLYHFLPDIVVLVVHLKARSQLALADAQECLDRLRRLYPPYISNWEGDVTGGHFPDWVDFLGEGGDSIGRHENAQLDQLIEAAFCQEKNQCQPGSFSESHSHILASHWAALLQPLGQGSKYRLLQLGDDRAALASKINLLPNDGKALIDCVDRGNMIRLCFADASGRDKLPYAKRYLEGFKERFCYDRFWYQDNESRESPSRIMNCGYAWTYLGDGRDKLFFANEFDGAPIAFRHIYVPMAIIAHFQKAALLVASRRLADLSPYGTDGMPAELDAKTFEQIEANFIAFTQTYWFDAITPQEQGIELFDMWRRELRLPQMYQGFRQELQDIVAYINAREEQQQTRSAQRLNKWALGFALFGTVLAILSFLAGVMGMNLLDEKLPGASDTNSVLLNMYRSAFKLLAWLYGAS